MSKIEKLTPEQEKKIPEYYNKWLQYTTSNSELDQEKCKEAISWAYQFAGFKAPTEFRFFDSPFECVKAIKQMSPGKTSVNYLESKFWWSGYYCFYDFLLQELFPEQRKDFPLFEKVENFIKHSGIIFPYEDICFVSRNPVAVKFDERGRLHNENGLAVEFADGTGVYSLDGVRVPRDVYGNVQSKENATAILALKNVEQRLVAIKYFGVGNMLKELKAKELDAFKDYKLYSISLEGKEQKLLEMQNPSEPKKHYEFVPPEILTCKRAMAWRIGMEDYSGPKTYS